MSNISQRHHLVFFTIQGSRHKRISTSPISSCVLCVQVRHTLSLLFFFLPSHPHELRLNHVVPLFVPSSPVFILSFTLHFCTTVSLQLLQNFPLAWQKGQAKRHFLTHFTVGRANHRLLDYFGLLVNDIVTGTINPSLFINFISTICNGNFLIINFDYVWTDYVTAPLEVFTWFDKWLSTFTVLVRVAGICL